MIVWAAQRPAVVWASAGALVLARAADPDASLAHRKFARVAVGGLDPQMGHAPGSGRGDGTVEPSLDAERIHVPHAAVVSGG